MQCEEARARIHEVATTGSHDADLQAHLAGCVACTAVASQAHHLDRVLALDVPHEPRPGFDTAFFARLDERRAKKPRYWLWGLAGALTAVAAAAVLVSVGPMPELGSDVELAGNLGVVMELELLEGLDPGDLELVRELDDVEAYELLAQVDVRELDALLSAPAPGVPQ